MRYNPRAVGGLGGFDIAPEAGIPRVQRQLILRICELGWLFRYHTPLIRVVKSGTAYIVRSYIGSRDVRCSTLFMLDVQKARFQGCAQEDPALHWPRHE